MKTLSLLAAALTMVLWQSGTVRADMMNDAQAEIGHLIEEIARSGCEFNSDGIWYSSAMAYFHLRDKYEHLRNAALIRTSEDFINQVGSESASSGEPYKVRCNGGQPVTSRQWLNDELARFRLSAPSETEQSRLLKPR